MNEMVTTTDKLADDVIMRARVSGIDIPELIKAICERYVKDEIGSYGHGEYQNGRW